MLSLMTVTSQTTEDQRFEAFARRDKSQRDAFVMAVTTTGVYCRPGCPARTPLRRNVRFFDDTLAALRAGFRACKRCHPDGRAPNADLVAQACRTIESAEASPSLGQLAGAAGLSPFHFHRLFKSITGVTPAAFAAAVRDQRAKTALAGGASVTEAVFDAGYGSASRFYEGAEGRFGMTPRAWRDKGRDAEIRLATAPCSLGWVLVATTDRGVCAVELGNDPEDLASHFRDRFSRARQVADDPELSRLVAEVVAVIEDPRGHSCELPLDVRGTAFQQRVWAALRQIPAGETRTYAEVASAVGAPNAVRAVGAACGANPVSVLTPCHRVIGTDSKLHGYRWGLERKKALLAREGG